MNRNGPFGRRVTRRCVVVVVW